MPFAFYFDMLPPLFYKSSGLRLFTRVERPSQQQTFRRANKTAHVRDELFS
jgi:hypothetical protein